MHQRSHFRNLWDAGYRRLVPIIPPDAALSEKSSLFRRPGARGKSPGVKGADGLWRGFDWLKHQTDESDIETWASWGAGVGVRTGGGLVAIDVDTKNGELCETIAAVIQAHLGAGPLRVGNAPKFLVLFASPDAIPYQRIDFDDGSGALHPARVEALTEGRQFVAHGVHPATEKPYYWPKGLVAASALTVVTRAQVDAFFAALHDALPAAARPVIQNANDGPPPPQDSLKGDFDLVRQAVNHLPNTVDLFPTYDDYIRVGAAIKGATQDDPDAGEQLWLQWAGRYDGAEFNADEALAHYRRIHAPYRLGARYLYDHADRYSEGRFNSALAYFKPVTAETLAAEEDPFAVAEQNAKPKVEVRSVDIGEWEGYEAEPDRWLVDGLIPEGEVSMFTGDGGTGKTLLAQQMATCIALGKPFLGQETTEGKSYLFLCEDKESVLVQRQRAINTAYCTSMAELAGRIRIAPRKFMDNILHAFDRNAGVMRKQAVWDALLDDIRAFRPNLVVIDTIADTFGGSEIDRQQVRTFIQGGLGAICAELGCAVLALGHPSQSGLKTKDGTSGSTAWNNSVRSRFYLSYVEGDKTRLYRTLESKKANYHASGMEWLLRYDRGAFDVVTATTPPAETPRESTGDALTDAIVYALDRAVDAKQPVSLAPTSRNYAPKVLRSLFPEALGMYATEKIVDALACLQAAGHLAEQVIGRREDNRNPIRSVVYVAAPASVFD